MIIAGYELQLDRNKDGSRYIGRAWEISTGRELTDDEVCKLQDELDSEINAMWG